MAALAYAINWRFLVALSEVTAGQTVRVLPGARIPLDGRVVKGETEVDTALGEILYVGKAKNLKNRVSSYFRRSSQDNKTMAMVARIRDVQVTVVA